MREVRALHTPTPGISQLNQQHSIREWVDAQGRTISAQLARDGALAPAAAVTKPRAALANTKTTRGKRRKYVTQMRNFTVRAPDRA
jgi:hypothetical protein